MSGYSGAAGVFVISMQIIFEDKEIETAVKNGEMCISVPFEVTINSEGEKTVKCFSDFKDVAEEYVKGYENALFSDEAIRFVRDKLSYNMNVFGYESDTEERGNLLYYFSDSSVQKVFGTKTGETVMLTKSSDFEKYILPEGIFSELDDGDELDVCFASVVDGRIVSYAAVNDLSEDGSYEINVETEEDCRRMGFGRAAASHLVSYIVSKNERVSYCCEKANTASVMLAKKLGLSIDKEVYSFVYYLKEY